jgi:TPR repeat protein
VLRLRILLVLVLASLWLSLATARAEDFRRGLSAYNLGDYNTAFVQWQALAERGDANAQAGLGFLYFKGLGVQQSYYVAADWYRKAAEQNQPEAQLFLGSLYFHGNGVRRDYVQAYKWCDLAQSNGAMAADECREAVGRRMSETEMREAIRLVAEWYDRHAAVQDR